MIYGKREALASLLCKSGLLKLLEKVSSGDRSLSILTYHGVQDIDPLDYPFDTETVSASCQGFDSQMNFVKNNFDVIGFETLIEYKKGKTSLPKRPLIITFDDGFANNYQHAFPILKRHRLPATIFLVTGLVGTDEVFWWERVVYWEKHAKNFIEIWKQLGHPVSSETGWRKNGVLRYLKGMQDEDRLSLLSEMEKQFPIKEPAALLSLVRPLRWNEIIEMSQCGIAFGSHTVTHPLLSRVSDEKLLFELQDSKKEIEIKIGKEALVLAYPVGRPADYNEKVVAAAKQAGYAFGLAYTPAGVNSRSIDDWYRMQRISVERSHSISLFRTRLFLPKIFL